MIKKANQVFIENYVKGVMKAMGILFFLLSMFSCDKKQEVSHQDQEEPPSDSVSEDISKLKMNGKLITYSFGVWEITNPGEDAVKLSMKELKSHYSYDMYTLGGEYISTMPMSKCRIKDQEFIIIGPNSKIQLMFSPPYSYDIISTGGVDYYVELRNHNSALPSIYYRSKNSSVYHCTMPREEALERSKSIAK